MQENFNKRQDFTSLPFSCGSFDKELHIPGSKAGRFKNVHLTKATQINIGDEVKPFHANRVALRKFAYIAGETPHDEKHAGDFLRALQREKCEHLVWLIPVEDAKNELCVYSLNMGEKKEGYTCSCILETSAGIKATLTSDDKKHKITIHQIRQWKDHKAPDLKMLRQFRENVENDFKESSGPLAVTCLAGVGRTGTYIAIDAAMKAELKHHEIKDLVVSLRQQRFGAIETLEQYLSIFQFLKNRNFSVHE